jgi:8-oxo-dGTP pyrophosphatase MutT (NUDIX family)
MTDRPLEATVTQRAVLFGPDGAVLVVRRASDGGWELPGGRLGSEESARQGLCREVIEETSLEVDVDGPVHTLAWRNDRNDGRFGVYYRCTVGRRGVTLSQEHTDYEWLPVPDAIDRLSGPQGRAVDRALDGAVDGCGEGDGADGLDR